MAEEDNSRLWADLEGFDALSKYPKHVPGDLRQQFRPDIMITKKSKGTRTLTIIELTCPFEEQKGLERAHERKTKKYEDFIEQIKKKTDKYSEINLHCVEVGARGHIATSLESIRHLLAVTKKGAPKTEAFLRTLGRSALKGSILIYRDRNKLFRDETQ